VLANHACVVDAESCWRQCNQVMLTTVLLRRLGRNMM
jgi:hypothetical protein